jgi:hypothetical protein
MAKIKIDWFDQNDQVGTPHAREFENAENARRLVTRLSTSPTVIAIKIDYHEGWFQWERAQVGARWELAHDYNGQRDNAWSPGAVATV